MRASLRRSVAAVAVAATLVAGSVVVAGSATADTAPLTPGTPATVTSDVLPTVQINGVVWNQQIAGNRVYVGGSFTTARPAGSAAGTNEVSRTNLLAYDLTTGVLIASFAPVLNGEVKDLALSPDGTTLYAAGVFTTVNGLNRYRVAAFDAATGALKSWAPTVNGTLYAVAASSAAVYLGGTMTSVNGTARSGLAAVDPATGAVLPFAPVPAGGRVQSIAVAPDQASVVVGGSFTTMNGSSSPGFGLARLAASDGSSMALPVNTYIRNGGSEAAVLDVETDGTNFYGSTYNYGGTGNSEGTFAADWATGTMIWVEDCHGDTYAVAPAGDVVYAASHKHYCGNSGGFPQTTPWTFHRATATSKYASGVNTADIYGYPDHAGQPKPELLYWYPDINTGTYTGLTQGPWTVTGNSQYVLYGGEFTVVDGVAQQGLVRFAVRGVVTPKAGPVLSGATIGLTATSYAAGRVKVTWKQNWDRDNETLTYKLYRGSISPANLVWSQTVTTPFWNTTDTTTAFIDRNLTPGSAVKYRMQVIDPDGNISTSDFASTTVATTPTPSAYSNAVETDQPTSYWRLDDATGSTTALDWEGSNTGAVSATGVTMGTAGAIGNDTDTAATFDGSAGVVVGQNQITNPQVFSIEAWFKTTTTSGGKIVGFGDSASTSTLSSNYDRHVYMDASGKLNFGVYNGAANVVSSAKAYNDGTWHQVVATLSSAGQTMYVDGRIVAQNSSVTTAQVYNGYWRIGGDTSWSGNAYFAGSIDDVSVYPSALSATQVDAHWVASGRTSNLPTAPADAYGAAVFHASPTLYWRLGENGTTTAADSGPLGNTGTYYGTYTQGVTGALSGVSDTATTFANPTWPWNSHGMVSSDASFAGPTVYSEEAWFKTTSTIGGKIIGFGSAQTGTSSSYDRHVYMMPDGTIRFGVWTGQENLASSTASYNDGNWHHVVATQASDGMNLYVDGVLVGTNAQTAAQAYSGYWRVGGDTTWDGANTWFDGTVDEVAVYPTELTATQVAQHYTLGGGSVNQPPTAAFTPTVTNLALHVDASASTDDHGISSYAWDFGDGTTGTGVTADHTYATASTYTVTLTVTDTNGVSSSTSQQVAVQAANQPPVAAFTPTVSNLSVHVDASASTDDRGIAGYAWDFGDGTTATGVTADHTYTAAGTYTVALAVTDTNGATTTTSRSVTVTAPNQPPTAAFTATPTGLSVHVDASASADPEGQALTYAWTFGDGTTATGVTADHLYAAANTYTVTLTVTDPLGAQGSTTQQVTVAAPNQPPTAAFTATTSGLSVHVDGSTSSDPEGKALTYLWNFGDGATATTVTADHTYATAATYTVTLTVTDPAAAQSTTTQQVTVVAPNLPPTAAIVATTNALTVHVDGTTSSDPEGQALTYAWSFGDGAVSTAATADHTYAAAGPYTITLTVTDPLGAQGTTTKQVTVAAPNQPPTAVIAATATGLALHVDGTGSTDPENQTLTFAWTFGDTATASTATTDHTYAAAGTYTVTLTVTDPLGASNTATKQVTVTAAPTQTTLANDAFGRTVSNGWGTADTGGAWTVSGGNARFSVNGSAGVMTLNPGYTTTATLGSVSSTSTDATVTVGMNALATGGGGQLNVIGRRASDGTTYGAQVKLLAGGAVQLFATRPGASVGGTVTGLTYAAGDKLHVRIQVDGTSPTTVRVKVWKDGTTEPTGWSSTFTDSTATSLQAAGSIGLSAYLSAAATTGTTLVTWDDLSATPVGAVANQAPTASFTSAVSGLAASFDGRASSDPDGTVAGYAWDFGDSTTATGSTATHTYTAGGTYAVKLTVTDNGGATNTSTQSVTVVAPPANQLAGDAFGRTVTNGWGAADLGGTWSTSGSVSRLSVAGGTGVYALRSGDTVGTSLTSVSSTATRLQTVVSTDKLPSGGNLQLTFESRLVGSGVYYGAQVKISPTGAVQLFTNRSGTNLAGGTVTGLTLAAGDQVNIAVQAYGTGTTTVMAKVWRVGTTEPTAWNVQSTDTTAALQVAGGVGLLAYLSAAATNIPVTVSYGSLAATTVTP